MIPKRGEVYLAALDPTSGNEVYKTRPALVLSNDVMHAMRYPLAIVVPSSTTLADGVDRASRWHVRWVEAVEDGPDRVGYFMPEQIRSVDLSRLSKKLATREIDVSAVRKAVGMLTSGVG